MKKFLVFLICTLFIALTTTSIVKGSIVDVKDFQNDFLVSAKSNLKTAQSYWNTNFDENQFKITVNVIDERIIINDSFEYSDGVYIRFSVLSTSTAKLSAGKTSELRVKPDGTYQFKRYSSGQFRNATANINVVSEDIMDGTNKLGYKLVISIAYEDLKVTKDTAKGLLTFAPFLCNENLNSSAIKGSLGYNLDYDYVADDQKTYIICKDDDKFKNNTGSYDTGSFAQVTQNTCWNISEDYADGNDARRVTLNGTNGQDNHLRFFASNVENLYVKASFKVTDIYNYEKFGKYGIEFRNKAGNGIFICLETNSTSGDKLGAKGVQVAGYVLIKGNSYDWTTYKQIGGAHNCVTEANELAIYRDKDLFYIFVNGKFVNAVINTSSNATDKIYPELVSFNIGLEVTNYSVSEDTTEIENILSSFTGDGNVFKAPSLAMTNGRFWDLTNDTKETSGAVILTGHDGADNNLFFNTSSNPNGFLYAKSRIVVSGINQQDYWPKFGLCIFDGSPAKGIFGYIDAEMSKKSGTVTLSDMVGTRIGHNTFGPNWGGWTLTSSAVQNNKDFMMEIVYGGGMVYLLVDGELAMSEKYSPSKANIYAGVKCFGLKLELTEYYASNDENDPTIQTSLAKIPNLTVGTSGATTDINTIISQIPDEEEIIPNDSSVVGDYGLLTIKTVTCYVGNGAKQIIPVFSNPLAKEKITYTYNSDNIVIKNGYVVGVKGGTSTVVTAKTSHLETKFIVKVMELNQRFISDYEYFMEHQKEANIKEGGIIFFGDSFFDQRYFWTNFYNDVAPMNAGDQVYITGIGGTTLEQWLGYAEHLVYDLKPSSLVIHLGTNDMFDTLIKENSCMNFFMQFVSEIHLNLPECQIYYIGIENRTYTIPGESSEYTINYLKNMNRRMEAYCLDKDYITFIPSFDHFTNPDGTCKAELFKDGVHPINEEYGYYLDLLIKAGLPIISNLQSQDTTVRYVANANQAWGQSDITIKKDTNPVSKNTLVEYTMTYDFAYNVNAHFGMTYGNDIEYRLLLWNNVGTSFIITAFNGTEAQGGHHYQESELEKIPGNSGTLQIKVLTTEDSIYFYVNGELKIAIVNTQIVALHLASEHMNVNISNLEIKDSSSPDYQALLSELSAYENMSDNNKFIIVND